eukprot:g9477.t1
MVGDSEPHPDWGYVEDQHVSEVAFQAEEEEEDDDDDGFDFDGGGGADSRLEVGQQQMTAAGSLGGYAGGGSSSGLCVFQLFTTGNISRRSWRCIFRMVGAPAFSEATGGGKSGRSHNLPRISRCNSSQKRALVDSTSLDKFPSYNKDCVEGWGDWGACLPGNPDTGESQRRRSWKAQPPVGKGKRCTRDTGKDSRKCGHCIGVWSDWKCAEPRTEGMKHRSYTIKHDPFNAGNPCKDAPGDHGEKDLALCPVRVNCEGHWRKWGSCRRRVGGDGWQEL